MVQRFNMKRFILVFAICTVIFTPLLIEAHNDAMNLAREEASFQFAPATEDIKFEHLTLNNAKVLNLAQVSGKHNLLFVGHQGLRPKIANR